MNSLIKKSMICAILTAPVFLMSYMPKEPDIAKVKEKAPEITIKTGKSDLSLKDLLGKKVLLHFWSKSDPQSRIDNHYNDLYADGRKDVVYIAICTDKDDENLSRLISENDGNSSATQYYRSQIASSSNIEAYTASGNGTWIISPEGIITSQSED